MERFLLGIIIPAFNEEKTIEKVIIKSLKYGPTLVINDGSKDKTAYLAKKAGASLVEHNFNKGYDSALNSGFQYFMKSKFKYILTIDADNQHDFEMIPKMLKEAEKGYDIVITNRNKKQRWSESLFGMYTFYRWQIRDPLSGLKLYKKNSLKSLNYNFNSTIGTKLLIEALINNKRVKELDTITIERNDKSRFGVSLISNIKIIKAFLITIYADLFYS